MFTKPIVSIGALVLATVASAKPIPVLNGLLQKRGHSFNGYGGYDSMSHFDDFYGSDDYSGVSQTLVKEKEVVCHSVEVTIVQQRLAVIREWYKKIITEQICEVEVQTIVHEQFVSGCEGFSSDLRHKSDRDVSYDHDIASQITDIHDSSSECVTRDFGWKGYDVGSHAISYSGDNWDSTYSPSRIDTVYGDCQQSYGYSSPSYSSSWSSSYSPPSYSYGSSEYTPSYGSYEYSSPSYDSSYGYGSNGYDSSYNSGYDSSYNSDHDSSHNSDHDSSYGSGYDSSYGSGYDSGYGSSYSPSTVVSSDSGCASCGSSAPLVSADSAPLPTDSALGTPPAIPTDTAALAGAIGSSLATATDIASAAAATDSAAVATDSAAAATDSAAAATDSAAAAAATDSAAAASAAAPPAASAPPAAASAAPAASPSATA